MKHTSLGNTKPSTCLFGLVALALIVFSALSLAHYGVVSAQAANPIRSLPSVQIQPGQTFDVTVTYTAPGDTFNSIGLVDDVPTDWIIQGNITWCTPNANNENVVGNEIQYAWYGPYSSGQTFTALYEVTVPGNASLPSYTFSGQLGYKIGGNSRTFETIGGDSQVSIQLTLTSTPTPTPTPMPTPTPTPTPMPTLTPTSTPLPGGGGGGGGGDGGGGESGGGGAIATVTPKPTQPPLSTPTTLPIATPPTPLPIPPLDLSGNMSASGIVLQPIHYAILGGQGVLNVGNGTTALLGRQPLQSITVAEVSVGLPAPPAGAYTIGYGYDYGPTGATFTPPITLTLKYDPGQVPSGVDASKLVIAYYDTTTKIWVVLPSEVDMVNHTVSAQISHLTTFAVYAPATTVTPTPTVTASPTPTPTPTTPAAGKKMNIGVIVGPITAVIVVGLVIYWLSRRRKSPMPPPQ